MLDKIMNYLTAHAKSAIAIPAAISGFEFMALLIQSASDGVISEQELHALLKAGSGFNFVILAIVLAYLHYRKKA